MGQELKALMFLTLVCTGTFLPAVLSAPPPQKNGGEPRKFVSKPNSPKKVYHKHSNSNLDHNTEVPLSVQNKQGDSNMLSLDGSSNSVQNMAGAGNLAWALAGPMMQLVRMFFGVPNELTGNSLTSGSDKMDSLTGAPGQGFSWGQVIGYALKLVFAAMGGSGNGSGHDGIDKIDTGAANSNPMQGLMKTLIGTLVGNEDANSADNMAKQTGELINLVIALMNALKTSFSQRALRARSLGEKDRMTEITLAAIDMGKAYAKTFNTTDDVCKELQLCQAARDCMTDVGQPNAYGICHLTAYATTNLMYYTQQATSSPSSKNKPDKTKQYMEATRRGRNMEDCKVLYMSCNETA